METRRSSILKSQAASSQPDEEKTINLTKRRVSFHCMRQVQEFNEDFADLTGMVKHEKIKMSDTNSSGCLSAGQPSNMMNDFSMPTEMRSVLDPVSSNIAEERCRLSTLGDRNSVTIYANESMSFASQRESVFQNPLNNETLAVLNHIMPVSNASIRNENFLSRSVLDQTGRSQSFAATEFLFLNQGQALISPAYANNTSPMHSPQAVQKNSETFTEFTEDDYDSESMSLITSHEVSQILSPAMKSFENEEEMQDPVNTSKMKQNVEEWNDIIRHFTEVDVVIANGSDSDGERSLSLLSSLEDAKDELREDAIMGLSVQTNDQHISQPPSTIPEGGMSEPRQYLLSSSSSDDDTVEESLESGIMDLSALMSRQYLEDCGSEHQKGSVIRSNNVGTMKNKLDDRNAVVSSAQLNRKHHMHKTLESPAAIPKKISRFQSPLIAHVSESQPLKSTAIATDESLYQSSVWDATNAIISSNAIQPQQKEIVLINVAVESSEIPETSNNNCTSKRTESEPGEDGDRADTIYNMIGETSLYSPVAIATNESPYQSSVWYTTNDIITPKAIYPQQKEVVKTDVQVESTEIPTKEVLPQSPIIINTSKLVSSAERYREGGGNAETAYEMLGEISLSRSAEIATDESLYQSSVWDATNAIISSNAIQPQQKEIVLINVAVESSEIPETSNNNCTSKRTESVPGEDGDRADTIYNMLGEISLSSPIAIATNESLYQSSVWDATDAILSSKAIEPRQKEGDKTDVQVESTEIPAKKAPSQSPIIMNASELVSSAERRREGGDYAESTYKRCEMLPSLSSRTAIATKDSLSQSSIRNETDAFLSSKGNEFPQKEVAQRDLYTKLTEVPSSPAVVLTKKPRFQSPAVINSIEVIRSARISECRTKDIVNRSDTTNNDISLSCSRIDEPTKEETLDMRITKMRRSIRRSLNNTRLISINSNQIFHDSPSLLEQISQPESLFDLSWSGAITKRKLDLFYDSAYANLERSIKEVARDSTIAMDGFLSGDNTGKATQNKLETEIKCFIRNDFNPQLLENLKCFDVSEEDCPEVKNIKITAQENFTKYLREYIGSLRQFVAPRIQLLADTDGKLAEATAKLNSRKLSRQQVQQFERSRLISQAEIWRLKLKAIVETKRNAEMIITMRNEEYSKKREALKKRKEYQERGETIHTISSKIEQIKKRKEYELELRNTSAKLAKFKRDCSELRSKIVQKRIELVSTQREEFRRKIETLREWQNVGCEEYTIMKHTLQKYQAIREDIYKELSTKQ